MLINQGGATAEEAEVAGRGLPRGQRPQRPAARSSTSTGSSGIVTRFDFGHSLYYNKPVGDVVAERLPRTILLALTCHLLASVLGIGIGIIAATRQYSWIDTAFGVVSFLGMTVPRFLLALIIIYILAFR